MSKAIFVDGANLLSMREPLGIGRYDFRGLYNLLLQVGKVEDLYTRPLFVISADSDMVIGKALRTVGFEVAVASTTNSADDKLIISQIEALPAEISEIVIVSADQDYAPALSEKARQGVKVYWVATKITRQDGRSMVSEILDPFFDDGLFLFRELSERKEEIMDKPWIDRSPRAQRLNRDAKKTQKLSITISLRDDERPAVLEALSEFIKACPSAQFRFSLVQTKTEKAF